MVLVAGFGAYAVLRHDERGAEVVGLREDREAAVRLALVQVSEYGYADSEVQAEARSELAGTGGSWTDVTGALTVTVSHHWVR